MEKFTPHLVGKSGDSLREAFGRSLTEYARVHKDVVLLDADIAGGTGAHHFRSELPDRFLQMGIAEQNMMGVAAGLSDRMLRPVVTTFAAFSLRGIEQVRLSIAYAQRNVKIFASHPGLDVGPDGASAQCLEDIAMFRSIPNMTVISPADPVQMEAAVPRIMELAGPVYVRTGRSAAHRINHELMSDFEVGKGQLLKSGEDLTIVACGVQVARALVAAEKLKESGIDARVINIHTIKPLDVDLLTKAAQETGALVVTEDHSIFGGLYGAVAECVGKQWPVPLASVCVSDRFGESGEPDELAEKYGLSPDHIFDAARQLINHKVRQ